VKYIPLTFFLLLNISNSYLNSVEVLKSEKNAPYFFDGIIIDKLNREKILINLEVGNTIESQTIKLNPKPNIKGEFKVEFKYETSLTIMDEGAHLDLTDWKHYVSEWNDLQKLSNFKYKIPILKSEERTQFPEVSSKEIYDQVLKIGGERWGALVKNVKNPNEYPCGISISKLILRISVHDKNVWKLINTIEFNIPMGD
jgi:hypothetical protein